MTINSYLLLSNIRGQVNNITELNSKIKIIKPQLIEHKFSSYNFKHQFPVQVIKRHNFQPQLVKGIANMT